MTDPLPWLLLRVGEVLATEIVVRMMVARGAFEMRTVGCGGDDVAPGYESFDQTPCEI